MKKIFQNVATSKSCLIKSGRPYYLPRGAGGGERLQKDEIRIPRGQFPIHLTMDPKLIRPETTGPRNQRFRSPSTFLNVGKRLRGLHERKKKDRLKFKKMRKFIFINDKVSVRHTNSKKYLKFKLIIQIQNSKKKN